MNKTERKAFFAACKSENPWAECCKIKVVRGDGTYWHRERIDPGVNFFVLMFEYLKLKTWYSCEGHPHGFYVTFNADAVEAVELHSLGFFHVQVEGPDYWSLRLAETTGTRRKWGEVDRIRVLTWAAQAWAKHCISTFPRNLWTPL